MMQCVIWNDLSTAEQEKILQRPAAVSNQNALQQTQQIIERVRQEGDTAVKYFTKLYDNVDLEQLQVFTAEFDAAEDLISDVAKAALQQAFENLQLFHQAQLPKNIRLETSLGVLCEMQTRPIQSVGLYVPGGTATLPSTVLMLGVPAAIAGCPQRVLCSPPNHDGSINPHILFAAKLCGIDKVYKIGGAQAIAAMAYGTETIPKVYKIFGPGNSWVTRAKILVAQGADGADYDLPAGPSEQMVIADKLANPAFVAADLLSQAEHGIDSQVMLVCDDPLIAAKVNQEIVSQIQSLPRKAIAEKALVNSYAIVAKNLMQAIEIANRYAAEHLILQVQNPRDYIQNIESAGSVFLGPWSPESVGDYASGTNHVLPTYGYCHSFSGLGVADFMKRITFQELTFAGLQNIAPAVETLATIENLEAHRRAVSIRLGFRN